MVATLVLPPQAGHDSCIVDFAAGQSQIETILDAGLTRVASLDWIGATQQTKDASIESYLDVIEQSVERLGGRVNLVGDCQGGWLAAIYAALRGDPPVLQDGTVLGERLARPRRDRRLAARGLRLDGPLAGLQGLVVSGAKVVATGSALTNANLIAHYGLPVKDKRFGVVFTVPMGTPGLKLFCRTSYEMHAAVNGSPFDYPLSSRMDENDCTYLDGAPFTVNMLAEPQDEVALHFAGKPMSGESEWERPDPALAPRLAGSLATVSCRPWQSYDGGDHVLYLGEVAGFSSTGGDPLVFSLGGFRHLGRSGGPGHGGQGPAVRAGLPPAVLRRRRRSGERSCSTWRARATSCPPTQATWTSPPPRHRSPTPWPTTGSARESRRECHPE